MTTTDTNITYYTLPLSGLSCQGCVKKVTKALEGIDGIRIEEIDTQSVSLEALGESTEYPLRQAVSAIEALGYQVGEHYHLALSGLNCGRCVAKVEAALDEQPTVFSHSVSKTEAHVHTSLSADTLIELVDQLGYQAELATDDSQNTETGSHTASDTVSEPELNAKPSDSARNRSAASHSEQAHSSSDDTVKATSNVSRQQYVLSGMTCASCVSSVENAISGVDGVANVSVNLAERSAIVKGNASPDAIVEAVENAGYGAEKVEDDNDRRERQQHQQAAELKNFKRSTIAGLGLGGPIMAWGYSVAAWPFNPAKISGRGARWPSLPSCCSPPVAVISSPMLGRH